MSLKDDDVSDKVVDAVKFANYSLIKQRNIGPAEAFVAWTEMAVTMAVTMGMTREHWMGLMETCWRDCLLLTQAIAKAKATEDDRKKGAS